MPKNPRADVLLEVRDLKKHFPIYKGVFRSIAGHVRAVDGVSFQINEGETLGLVGESGCGKTTTGRCIIRLLDPTSGSVLFRMDDQLMDIAKLNGSQMKEVRQQISIIFQDPFSSLSPRMTVRDIIAEPLKIHHIGTRQKRNELVSQQLDKVGLSSRIMDRYPHEFSGGQRQRIAIARALILNPRLVICDEPVSALDVSVQAQVVNLLEDLQKELDLTYLFIAHDLSVVEHISDRVMVMYLGKPVEVALADELYQEPKHPYTEALLSAIPIPDPKSRKSRIRLEGTVPNPATPPTGCNFHTRCRYCIDECQSTEPDLVPVPGTPGRQVACLRASELALAGYVPVSDGKAG